MPACAVADRSAASRATAWPTWPSPRMPMRMVRIDAAALGRGALMRRGHARCFGESTAWTDTTDAPYLSPAEPADAGQLIRAGISTLAVMARLLWHRRARSLRHSR